MADDGKIKIYGEFDSATAERILADVSQIRGAAKSTDINAINTQIQQIEQQIAGGGSGGGGGTADIPTVEISSFNFSLAAGNFEFSEAESQALTAATASDPPLIRLIFSQGSQLVLKIISANGIKVWESNVWLIAEIYFILSNQLGTWGLARYELDKHNHIYIDDVGGFNFDEATHTLESSYTGIQNAIAVSNLSQVDVYPLDRETENFLDAFLTSNIISINERNNVVLQLKDTCAQKDIPQNLQLRVVVMQGEIPMD